MANNPTFDYLSIRLNRLRERIRSNRQSLEIAFETAPSSKSGSTETFETGRKCSNHSLKMVLDKVADYMISHFTNTSICPLRMHFQVEDHMLSQGHDVTWSEQVTKDDLISVIDRHYESVVAKYKGGAAQIIEDAFTPGGKAEQTSTIGFNQDCEFVGVPSSYTDGDTLQ